MQFEEAYIGACVEYTGSELALETTGQIIANDKGDSQLYSKDIFEEVKEMEVHIFTDAKNI